MEHLRYYRKKLRSTFGALFPRGSSEHFWSEFKAGTNFGAFSEHFGAIQKLGDPSELCREHWLPSEHIGSTSSTIGKNRNTFGAVFVTATRLISVYKSKHVPTFSQDFWCMEELKKSCIQTCICICRFVCTCAYVHKSRNQYLDR